MRRASTEGGEDRRFACTSCGKCCDRGPEMELSEATALSGSFVTSLIIKVHSIPLNARSERAAQWWREQGSRIPLRAAYEEKRRHLAAFASRRRSDRQHEREIYLDISAIVDDYGGGQCPALIGGLCSIYESRPLTCRTVPLHYSRQPSALRTYIDQFTATPGYECDTVTSPIILKGSQIVSPELRLYRERAVEMSKADRRWKERLLYLMDNPQPAARGGLPTYESVLINSDNGYATLLPMIVAWRVAESSGILLPDELSSICKQQLTLIRAKIAGTPSFTDFDDLLPLYERGAVGQGRLNRAGSLAEAAPAWSDYGR